MTRLGDIAHSVLFGTRWEDKLRFAPDFADTDRAPALVDIPSFPGRPETLRRVGKADFPKADELTAESARGRLLHFFANHELMAMELMALMLLKFPDAPEPFRAGVARTIGEEQNHLRLYVHRMRELGIDFGELPVSDYFWNAMKGMESPLQFVVQMSLTLEQANLDFSLFYQHAVAKTGDEKTAAVLERVYREEIGHVRHGVTWFNRWRGDAGDDWDAYQRLLPAPMTPRRAKGVAFAANARREAGLSERFIRELEVYSGSKGRPPVFWIYNPGCDAEIARGKPGFTPPEKVRRLNRDLETLPMFLGMETDVVLVDELPRAEWLKTLRDLEFRTPEFRRAGRPGETPREDKIGGVQPWGWSPEPFARFRPWRDRLIAIAGGNGPWSRALLDREDFAATGLGPVFSKAWSADLYRRWLPAHTDACGPLDSAGVVHRDWASARDSALRSLDSGITLLAKAPWGTSGGGNRRILDAAELDATLGGWIRNIIENQGAIVLERWLEKVADLSVQIVVGKSENDVRLVGIRHYVNGSRLEYRGTHLDAKLRSLPPEALRLLHSPAAPLERWRELALTVGAELWRAGYQGPAGIDAMIWREGERLYLKPLVELNPRWTMGRVAIELEAHVLPGTPALWRFLPARELPAPLAETAAELTRRHPPRLETAGAGPRIASGVVFTTDPTVAREVLTVLVVGAAAVEDPMLKL